MQTLKFHLDGVKSKQTCNPGSQEAQRPATRSAPDHSRAALTASTSALGQQATEAKSSQQKPRERQEQKASEGNRKLDSGSKPYHPSAVGASAEAQCGRLPAYLGCCQPGRLTPPEAGSAEQPAPSLQEVWC